MKSAPKPAPRKLGANRNEPAKKAANRDANFKQSKDIREDRSQMQSKNASSSHHGK